MTDLHKFLAVWLVVISPFLLTTALDSECTVDMFTTDSKQCPDQFFDEITKKSVVGNCSISYRTMASCIERKKAKCLDMSVSQNTAQQIIQSADRFVANEEFYCKHGMFQSQSRQKISGCRKKFYKKAAKCEKKFYSFFNNRGTASVDLCRSFFKGKQCMKKYLGKFCQPNTMVEYKISQYGDSYNPYCPGRKDPEKETYLDEKFGHCTWRSYEKLMRKCTAGFVKTLMQNNGRKCNRFLSTVDSLAVARSTFRKYQSCEKVALVYCMNGSYGTAEELNRVVDESLARRRESDRVRLCSKARINVPPINSGQCKEGYTMKVQECGDKMSETYKGNRADPSLCREYAQAKLCAKKVTKAMCTMDTNIKAFMELHYDNFNPFCSSLSDPNATATNP